jgi:hypothetical protein
MDLHMWGDQCLQQASMTGLSDCEVVYLASEADARIRELEREVGDAKSLLRSALPHLGHIDGPDEWCDKMMGRNSTHECTCGVRGVLADIRECLGLSPPADAAPLTNHNSAS